MEALFGKSLIFYAREVLEETRVLLQILFSSSLKNTRTTMTTSVIPSHTTHNQVKVNVRLCGSIPRLAMSTQQEHLCLPQSLRTLPLFPAASDQENSSPYRSSKDDSVAASKLQSDLCNLQQQQSSSNQETQPQHNFYPGTTTSSRPRSLNTYEAPTWAVPASGEARLEVSC